MSSARVIGVLGAGTMGAGIAQLAARSGAHTLLHDPFPDALERGVQSARDGLGKEAAKGRLSKEQAEAAAERLQPVGKRGLGARAGEQVLRQGRSVVRAVGLRAHDPDRACVPLTPQALGAALARTAAAGDHDPVVATVSSIR